MFTQVAYTLAVMTNADINEGIQRFLHFFQVYYILSFTEPKSWKYNRSSGEQFEGRILNILKEIGSMSF